MKTLIFSTFVLVFLSSLAYGQDLSNTLTESALSSKVKNRTLPEDKVWRVGLQLGNCASNAKYSEGAQIANARFKQHSFGAPNINVVARYDVNTRWMLLTGFGLNAIGFGYSISENYSLINAEKKVSDIKTIFPTLEVPFSVFYKFKPNCKGAKWLIGAGMVPTLGSKQSIHQEYSISTEGSSANYLSSESVSHGGAYMLGRLSIGRERVYRNGSILQASLLFNMGFNTMATSTVHYTIDNHNYSHTFSNDGSSIGFRLAYFLKPFGKY